MSLTHKHDECVNELHTLIHIYTHSNGMATKSLMFASMLKKNICMTMCVCIINAYTGEHHKWVYNSQQIFVFTYTHFSVTC